MVERHATNIIKDEKHEEKMWKDIKIEKIKCM